MTAEEAKKLAEEKALSFETIIGDIKREVECGASMISFPILPIPMQVKLMGYGYSLSEHTDPFRGVKFTIISWR